MRPSIGRHLNWSTVFTLTGVRSVSERSSRSSVGVSRVGGCTGPSVCVCVCVVSLSLSLRPRSTGSSSVSRPDRTSIRPSGEGTSRAPVQDWVRGLSDRSSGRTGSGPSRVPTSRGPGPGHGQRLRVGVGDDQQTGSGGPSDRTPVTPSVSLRTRRSFLSFVRTDWRSRSLFPVGPGRSQSVPTSPPRDRR